MNKLKLTTLTLSTIFFIACGDSYDEYTRVVPTSVVVERGPVYEAVVKDANGNIATQVGSSNKYLFDTFPDYPISVNSGWIDVDLDSKKTTYDINLTTTLVSYSNIITPITTYIADESSSIRDEKLLALSVKLGVDKEELLKTVSQGNINSMLAQNAVYRQLKLNDDKETISLENIQTDFDTYKTLTEQTPDKTKSELSVVVETELINLLLIIQKETSIDWNNTDMSAEEISSYNIDRMNYLISYVEKLKFQNITNAEVDTQYTSNELLMLAFDISILDDSYSIVKNNSEITDLNTSVYDGETISLRTKSSASFGTKSSFALSLADLFVKFYAQEVLNSTASALCEDINMQLPSLLELENNFASNSDLVDINVSSYWTSDSVAQRDETRFVKCMKKFDDIVYSITTKNE